MKTVLITGANRGIGLEHATRFAASGATVFAGVRDAAKAADLKKLAEKYPGKISLFDYDAREEDAAASAKAAVAKTPLDLVFANAGVFERGHQEFGEIAPANFMDSIKVNPLAPLLLAEALVDEVAASTRKIIAFQSSQLGSNADSRTGSYYAYRASKAALNKVSSSLAAELKPRGITVVSLHPGWVRTDMGGANADISVAECVDGQQKVLNGLTLAQSGGFYSYDGRTINW